MQGPDPSNKHPMEGFHQVCFIKNTVTNPNIIIGDFTYSVGWSVGQLVSLKKMGVCSAGCEAIDRSNKRSNHYIGLETS